MTAGILPALRAAGILPAKYGGCMCLAIPGKVVEMHESEGILLGKVDFGGIVKQVCLEYTPDVKMGEYVIVHVGFSLSKMDEEEAARTYKLLEELNQLSELDVPDLSQDELIAKMKSGI